MKLDKIYPLDSSQISGFRKNGFIKLKEVLDPVQVEHFNHLISKKVKEINQVDEPLEERSTYGKAFLQLFNLWQEDDEIRKLVFSKRIAGIAADLMQVDGVRLYHDQALFKEAGGGITPWHADQFYWPLDSEKTITAWIPLQATPLEMGPLEFSAGSHRIKDGRDLHIGDESELVMTARLQKTNCEHITEPFDSGEISFHAGWVFHRAGVNTTDQMRKVMTIIYMDKDMVLKEPENESQINDWHRWCPGAIPWHEIDTPLNPILYP